MRRTFQFCIILIWALVANQSLFASNNFIINPDCPNLGKELVINGDFSQGVSGYFTDYTYTFTGQGCYIIDTTSEYWQTTHGNHKDHTTGHGNMMLIDGANISNKIIWQENINIQQNTYYVFSIWSISLCQTYPPILQFSINDVKFDTPFLVTGDTTKWHNFSFTWYSGSSNTASIKIIDSNISSFANDFCIDDISFKACCNNKTLSILATDLDFCSKNSVTLRVNDTLSSYQWYKIDSSKCLSTKDSLVVTEPNQYYLIAQDSNGCTSYSDTVKVTNYGNGFDYPDFSSINNLNIISDGKQIGNYIKLVNATYYNKCAIWYKDKLPLANGFVSEFTFRFAHGNNNGWVDSSLPGADGLAFVIQNFDNTIVGSHGYALGYEGIPKSIAVEFDMFANDSNNVPHEVLDPNGNHIAVQSLGTKANTAYHGSPQTLGIQTNPMLIKSDSTLYYVKIDYKVDGNKLRIFLNTAPTFTTPTLVVDNINLYTLLGMSKYPSAYIGITASTGNSFQDEYLYSWKACAFDGDSIVSVNNDGSGNIDDGVEAFPNPFNNVVSIKYNSAEFSDGVVKIYDIYGREIEKIYDGIFTQGENIFKWNANNFEQGTYYCVISTKYFRNIHKIIYLK